MDPWDEIRKLEERMNQIFRDFWTDTSRLLPGSVETGISPYRGEVRTPFVDVQETDKEIIIGAEIPGVDKRDITINATEDSIEISAEVSTEAKEEKEGFLRRERRYGKFYRSLPLPSEVDPTKAKATYKNGILEIRLPKVGTSKKKTIKVE